MAAAAILDFVNFKLLTARQLKRADLRRRAKFGPNWSNTGRDMAIFRFLKMAAAPSWIFKISNFQQSGGPNGSKCVVVPNYVEIGQTVAEIMAIFRFLGHRLPMT